MDGSPGVGVTSKLRFAYTLVFACALVLLAGPALALGLGRIEVKSQPGQPLLAEIQVISADPSELEHLQARLAAPETFRRVGLQPPDIEVSGLQFAVALDARGHPVIRVTSATALRQPLLTFLLEVDWGQGRLVREYSTLLNAPNTVAAPTQPIQAPLQAPSNTIVRLPPAAVVAAPAPTPVAAAPATPQPTPIRLPPPTPVVAASASAPAPASAPPPSNEYTVRRGDTLSQIAGGLGNGYSLDQSMLALLRANPDAFIGDNINRLKAGAVLRMPRADELSRYSAGQAAAVARTQIAQWREARAPQPQPAAVAQAITTAPATRGSNAAAGETDARLEIVPTSSGRGQRAGGRNQAMRSGIQAGGEGDMLRQQLQEGQETLAARDAEIGELKTRVAELEKLQQQQQQLIAMKDSALAAAQQTLARSNLGAAKPAPQTATQQPVAPEKSPDSSAGLWLWGGALLLVLALLGWLFGRRRRPVPAAPSRGFDAVAMAASMPRAAEDVVVEDLQPDEDTEDVDDSDDASVTIAADDADVMPAPMPLDPPHWTAAPAQVGMPTWHDAEPASPAAEASKPRSASEQLELARAYLDLGDADSARELLREILDSRDPAAREAAARMLREL